MKELQVEKLGLRISAVILLRKGEISIEDINSLPFVESDRSARIIADSLLKLFDADVVCKKISSSPFLKWEESIFLRNPSKPVALTSTGKI